MVQVDLKSKLVDILEGKVKFEIQKYKEPNDFALIIAWESNKLEYQKYNYVDTDNERVFEIKILFNNEVIYYEQDTVYGFEVKIDKLKEYNVSFSYIRNLMFRVLFEGGKKIEHPPNSS